MNKERRNIYSFPLLIILSFLLLAYLPVFLPFFHLKNDLVTQNLPGRYFISESLYSQNFPWWNPYLNFGTPQYGDMNNGFWNPVLWFVAKFFSYNVLTITLEEMLYIFLGGWGFLKLMLHFKIPIELSIISGLSYMSGGYILGHLQHFCWITGTAFFPFLLLYYLKSLSQPLLKHFIVGALFAFLFVSSTHLGLIIGSMYFFLLLILHQVLIAVQNKNSKKI